MKPQEEQQPALLTKEGEAYQVPEGGSLGLLALGYEGLMIWRHKRAELQKARQAMHKPNAPNTHP